MKSQSMLEQINQLGPFQKMKGVSQGFVKLMVNISNGSTT